MEPAVLIPRADALTRAPDDLGPVNLIELGSRCRTLNQAHPMPVRHHQVELTPAQKRIALEMMAAREQCGNTFKAFRGLETRGGIDFDVRLVAQTHCGLRACERCDRMIRRHQRLRMLGPWELFITFTVPREPWTAREAWEGLPACRKVFFRELRRECYHRSRSDMPAREPYATRAVLARALANSRIRGPSKLEYAWAVEDHEDGYPHLHTCMNMQWIDYKFIRELWSRSCGVVDAMVRGIKVYAPDGVCWYLSDYVSKGGIPLEILAIMKGKRLWASTLEAEREEEPKWIEEKVFTNNELSNQVQKGCGVGAGDGWNLEYGNSERYGFWSRISSPVKFDTAADGTVYQIGTLVENNLCRCAEGWAESVAKAGWDWCLAQADDIAAWLGGMSGFDNWEGPRYTRRPAS